MHNWGVIAALRKLEEVIASLGVKRRMRANNQCRLNFFNFFNSLTPLHFWGKPEVFWGKLKIFTDWESVKDFNFFGKRVWRPAEVLLQTSGCFG